MIEGGDGSLLHRVMDTMRGNPSCIAVMALAITFALLNYWSLNAERKEMHERQLKLIDRCTVPHGG